MVWCVCERVNDTLKNKIGLGVGVILVKFNIYELNYKGSSYVLAKYRCSTR